MHRLTVRQLTFWTIHATTISSQHQHRLKMLAKWAQRWHQLVSQQREKQISWNHWSENYLRRHRCSPKIVPLRWLHHRRLIKRLYKSVNETIYPFQRGKRRKVMKRRNQWKNRVPVERRCIHAVAQCSLKRHRIKKPTPIRHHNRQRCHQQSHQLPPKLVPHRVWYSQVCTNLKSIS